MNPAWSDPILSCPEAKALEARLFGGNEEHEWAAMERAGAGVAAAVLEDFKEIGGLPSTGRVLVLAGKGHNGGDALLAAATILTSHPAASADIVFVLGERALRPLAARAWRRLMEVAAQRVCVLPVAAAAGECGPSHVAASASEWTAGQAGAGVSERGAGETPATTGERGSSQVAASASKWTPYDLCLDGIFGFQFRPPVDAVTAGMLRQVNAHPSIRLRAAVDLPSGLGELDKIEHPIFRADFTYATGSVKAPLLEERFREAAGRLRYVDLGFFDQVERVAPNALDRVLKRSILAPLTALRAPGSDKRTFGHLFIIGGSRSYPGAVLMCVRAALRSGAGRVTAFVPESFVPAFAAYAPEAIWVGWPETPEGGLALEGLHLLRAQLAQATALVMGSGLGAECETQTLAGEIVKLAGVPVVLDADALQPSVLGAARGKRVICLPHAGEFKRLAGGRDASAAALRAMAQETGATIVCKGPVTRIADGDRVYHSFFGGPVLARGGSGDLLAGLTGGLLAQAPDDPLAVACRGVVWHGMAADLLARDRGQVAVQVTQLLNYLPAALGRACR